MARKPRIFSTNNTYHILQMSDVGQVCFDQPDDYRHYLTLLCKWLKVFNVKLHAFVLLQDQIQLLLTPSNCDGITTLMQAVSSNYVRYFNKNQKRSGNLFRGRYKASIIDTNNFLITCMGYIEISPVITNQVEHPSEYPWSSYQLNSLLFHSLQFSFISKISLKSAFKLHPVEHEIELIDAHPLLLKSSINQSLNSNFKKQIAIYLLDKTLVNFVQEHLQHNYPIGGPEFVDNVIDNNNINYIKVTPGRPKKTM